MSKDWSYVEFGFFFFFFFLERYFKLTTKRRVIFFNEEKARWTKRGFNFIEFIRKEDFVRGSSNATKETKEEFEEEKSREDRCTRCLHSGVCVSSPGWGIEVKRKKVSNNESARDHFESWAKWKRNKSARSCRNLRERNENFFALSNKRERERDNKIVSCQRPRSDKPESSQNGITDRCCSKR